MSEAVASKDRSGRRLTTQLGPYTVFEAGSDLAEEGRRVTRIAKTDLMTVLLHVWDQGGEAGAHYHSAEDATWIVVEGQVTFFREDDQEIATLKPNQGLFIPHGAPYWFENTGTQKLVMVRASGHAAPVDNDRVYANPRAADLEQSSQRGRS